MICVGKLYNTAAGPVPKDTPSFRAMPGARDYHDVLRAGLERMVRASDAPSKPSSGRFASTPRRCWSGAYARLAGLGWIGKNTCLIHEPLGSWFFLGEIMTSLELEAGHAAAGPLRHLHPLHRCLPHPGHRARTGWSVDARRCISYFTIELRGPVPEEHAVRDRDPRFRLRHLPGRVPLELPRAHHGFVRSPASWFRPLRSARLLPRPNFAEVRGEPSRGPSIQDSCATSRSRWGTAVWLVSASRSNIWRVTPIRR